MHFSFKRIKHKHLKPSLCIRSTSGISDIDNLPSMLGSSRPAKFRKLFGRPRHHVSSALSTSPSTSMSSSSGSSGSPVTGISEMVLEPYHYAELLLQASATAAGSQRSSDGESTSTRPGQVVLGTFHEETLPAPPSTPFQTFRARCSDGYRDSLMEGITYEAILASNLNRSFGFGIGERDDDDDSGPPETRVPPNTLAGMQIYTGGYSSLMAVSLAIMEGRGPSSRIV